MADYIKLVSAQNPPPTVMYEEGPAPCVVTPSQLWPGQLTAVRVALTGKGKKPIKLNRRPIPDVGSLQQLLYASDQWTRTSTFASPFEYDLPAGSHEGPLDIRYTQEDSSRREAFEAAKKDGRIYVNPDYRFRATVWDDPRVVSYSSRVPFKVTRGCTELGDSYKPASSACVGGGGFITPWDSSLISAFKPNTHQSNPYSIPMDWELYRDVHIESRTRGNYVQIKQALTSIAEAIRGKEFSTALITSGLAERNAAYWDIATEIGELPETIKAIYSGLKAILTKYLEARRKVATLRKNSISSGSLVGDVASVWMNFRYGIGPIAYSIEDMLSYLYKQGVFNTTRSGENRIFEVPLGDGSSFEVTTRDRFWSKVRVDPNHALNGLQTNLFKTAWELVPLSFVIDWVLNIGDLLSTLSGPNGEIEGVTTYSRKCSVFFELPFGGGRLPTQMELYSRSIINPSAHVGVVINPTMTYKRWLDAAALSWNQVKSEIRNQL